MLFGQRAVVFSLSGPHVLGVKKDETSKQCQLEWGPKRCHCTALTLEPAKQSRMGQETSLSHGLDQGQATSPNKSQNRLTRRAKGPRTSHACKYIPKQEQEWYAYNPFRVKDWAGGQR